MFYEDEEIDIGEAFFPEEFFFDVEIDMAHVQNIDNFEKLSQDDIDDAVGEGLTKASYKVFDIISEEMEKLELGKLVNELSIYTSEQGYEVRIDDPQATFVEFGTGIVGKGEMGFMGNPAGKPHPEAKKQSWVYDINKHGKKGWYAPMDNFDPTPYKTNRRGKPYGWTRGLPARPFFYNAVQRIKRTGIITRTIRKELRKFL